MSENTGDEENKGKEFERKYVKNDIEIIKEESDYSDDEAEGEGEAAQEEDNAEDNENTLDEPDESKVENDLTQEIEDQEEKIITSKLEPLPKLESKKISESSLSSFTIISKAELNQDFEHLSNFDPEDDFLQSERSYSVIGSVISRDEDAISEYSDFSLMSSSRVSQIRGGNVMDSEVRDIYVEDIVMNKIIYFISLFSEDVKEYLGKLRSKEGLLQNDRRETVIDYFDIELDNIDENLIRLILDVLEHFDMFRLCLIICNRYNLKTHISRYLTSICFKYSNLKLLDMTKILKINDTVFRSNQRQVNVLANEAIHGMLRLMDSKMMEQQCTENLDENSKLLGAECWRYLYYLGFWKKLIYLMDTHSSLKLCYSIGAFDDFKTVYLVNYRSLLTDDEIKSFIDTKKGKWIADENTVLVTYLCAKVALEESIETLDNTNIPDMCQCNINLNNCLKAFNEDKDKSRSIEFLCKALNAADERFIKFSNRVKGDSDIQIDLFNDSNYNNDKLYIDTILPLFDIFLLYGRIFENKECRNIIKEAIEKGYAVRYQLIRISTFLVTLVDSPTKHMNVFNPSEITVVLQGIYSPFKIRIPEPSNLILNTLSNSLMHKDSSFFKFLEKLIVDLN